MVEPSVRGWSHHQSSVRVVTLSPTRPGNSGVFPRPRPSRIMFGPGSTHESFTVNLIPYFTFQPSSDGSRRTRRLHGPGFVP